MNYADRIKRTDEQVEEQELNHDVAQAKLQAQSDLLATQLALKTAQQGLENTKCARPLSVANIVAQQHVVDDYIRGEAATVAIIEELF
tara:strand:- start:6565 stop:6828 length:264 start_codon:yes stop_codon:yes gene_type:complete